MIKKYKKYIGLVIAIGVIGFVMFSFFKETDEVSKVKEERGDYLLGATYLFEDGFESGDFSAWDGDTTGSGATMEVVSNTQYAGTYSAHFSVPSGSWATIYKALGSSYSTLYIGGHVKLNETPASGDAVTMIGAFSGTPSDANTISIAGLWNVDGTPYWYVKWRDGSSLTKSTSSCEATTGEWHFIQTKTKVDGSDGEIKLFVDGRLCLSLTGEDTDANGNISHVSAECGTWGEGSSAEDWIDDYKVSESLIPFRRRVIITQ